MFMSEQVVVSWICSALPFFLLYLFYFFGWAYLINFMHSASAVFKCKVRPTGKRDKYIK